MRLGGRARSSSSSVRPAVVGLSLASIAACAAVACIPDPKGDFEDFVARTSAFDAGSRPLEQSDAAQFDAKPPETAVEALYVGICVTTLAAGDPEQALRFYTESKYTPDAPGASTGQVTFKITPMVGWDIAGKKAIKPATASKSETRGPAIDVPPFAVSADGRYTANLGTINLVREANSISGRDAIIQGAVLNGLYGVERFCATLGGQLTSPYALTFKPEENTCIFQKVNEGDPLPAIPAGDFVCKP